MKKIALVCLLALAVAPTAAAGGKPVPSLTPAATHALWVREVARARRDGARALADTPCRPARVIFYAQTDWLRLATKLAQAASPCAQYYVSIPPLTSDKTQPRPGQAALIRALAPNFHAVDEISYTAWSKWVTSGAGSFSDAGALAQQRMAAAGFDPASGDTWALNELSSAVRAGTGNARANALALVQGLASAGIRGIVFAAGVSQSLPNGATYKVNVQNWLQDSTFWSTLAPGVTDFAYESYGDVRDYAVDGSTPQQRRDAMAQYLGHVETLANAAPAAGAAAQAFLRQAYTTFGNAAWSWPSAYGFTAVPLANMEDFVAGQAYASRAFAAATGATVDRFGYAWAPSNVSTSDSAALLGALAVAVRDSGVPNDDVGSPACAGSLCTTVFPGAAFTSVWQQFATWSQAGLGFSNAPFSFAAGAVAGPLVAQVQTAGVPDVAKADTPVTFTSSSPSGGFSTASTGPFTPSLSVTIPAGSSTASVYYTDTLAGTPTVSATVAGQPPAVQQETVTAAAPSQLAVAPATATVTPGTRLQFVSTARDTYGNAVPATVAWQASTGTITSTGMWTAPKRSGTATISATAGTLTATATVTVTAPKPVVVAARAKRVTGHVVATVRVSPAMRVRIAVRVRRGSSVVASVAAWTTPAGSFTWRSKNTLPAGRYVVKATIRSASTA